MKQNQLFERERKRWEKLDYEYLRKENQSMMNKERNLVGRKNNPGMAFNPLNLQYDNSVQGEILKRRDEESKYRAWLRSVNIDKHSNTGYNILNGEERTILEQRLNKDIVPDLIQKNIDQINEMRNKIVFNYNNFYTRCNPSSPDLKGYRYDNSNNNYNGNINNRSTSTPNIINNNGGRYRAPIDLRDERVARSNIMPRGGNNNINNYNNNDFNNNYMNNRNTFSPPPRSPNNIPYEVNNINNNYNNNNFYNNERNNDMNNNINNNINNYNNDRRNNMTPNVGIIDLNNMDMNNNRERINQREGNNNTINNNAFMNNNMNNNNNGPTINQNQINQPNNYQNINENNINNNNLRENGNNSGGNDFYNKGNASDVNNNNNIDQRDLFPKDYQGQVQSNYGVNPYNPYSRPELCF